MRTLKFRVPVHAHDLAGKVDAADYLAAHVRDQMLARAAHAHVSQAEAMVRQGLATRSDALLASVRLKKTVW